MFQMMTEFFSQKHHLICHWLVFYQLNFPWGVTDPTDQTWQIWQSFSKALVETIKPLLGATDHRKKSKQLAHKLCDKCGTRWNLHVTNWSVTFHENPCRLHTWDSLLQRTSQGEVQRRANHTSEEERRRQSKHVKVKFDISFFCLKKNPRTVHHCAVSCWLIWSLTTSYLDGWIRQ